MKLNAREISAFIKNINNAVANHKALLFAIDNCRNKNSLESMLVEQFVLSITIKWEAFINDLFIAYILMSPRHSFSELKQSVTQKITEIYGNEMLKCVKIKSPVKMNEVKVSALYDKKGWNITASNASQLSKLANKLLVSKYARKFSLAKKDSEFFDFLIDLRNYLSHYSILSRNKLIASIENFSGAENVFLKTDIRLIGPYLKYKINNGESRAEFIATRLIELSQRLR